MTLVLGLTGSIAMGKSTITQQFKACGAKVSDADAIVHHLYVYDEAFIRFIATEFPQAMKDQKVDRRALGQMVFQNSTALKKLEDQLHPKVRQAHLNFIAAAKRQNDPLVVLDIPLLYETGAEILCDKVVVVSTTADIQKNRVLSRPSMTAEKLEAILAKQMPDAQKRERADFIIDTSFGLENSLQQVKNVMTALNINLPVNR